MLELRSGRVIHAYLGLLTSRVDSASIIERLSLLIVGRDGEVHVMHSFFSVPVVPYAAKQFLLVFRGELTLEGLPPIVDIPVASLAVRC